MQILLEQRCVKCYSRSIPQSFVSSTLNAKFKSFCTMSKFPPRAAANARMGSVVSFATSHRKPKARDVGAKISFIVRIAVPLRGTSWLDEKVLAGVAALLFLFGFDAPALHWMIRNLSVSPESEELILSNFCS